MNLEENEHKKMELDKTFVEGEDNSLYPPYGQPLQPGTRISSTQFGNVNPYTQSKLTRTNIGAQGISLYDNILPSGNEQVPLGSGYVVGILGSGGMARVYKIWNERLEVFRAVKILLPTQQSDLKSRFDTEAKITAKLHHPNIVEIYSVGEYKGLPYIEMEFIDGKSLETIIAETDRLPPAVCSAIGIFIARALVYAHSQEYLIYGKTYHGIIHRDLKPANIMISKCGDVKLMDFGIARPKEASLHTVEGNIVGTMQYLSPEQLDGVDIDARTDIYSFGTILYEMLTGTKTFPQDTITNLMKKKITNEYRKFSEFDFHVPSVLAKISQKCLQLDKKDRYPTAEALLKDLEAAHKTLTSETPEEVIKRFISDPFSFKTEKQLKLRFPLHIPLKVVIPVMGALFTAGAIGVFIITGPIKEDEIEPPPFKKDTSLVARDTIKKDTLPPKEDTLKDYIVKGDSTKAPNPNISPPTKGGGNSGGTIKPPVPPPPRPPVVVVKRDSTVIKKDTLEEIKKKYGKEDIVELTLSAMRANDINIVPFLLSKIPDYESTKKKILLLEFYLLTGRLNEAENIASESINDAYFEYLCGKLYERKGNLSMALTFYERSLTKPSVIKNPSEVRNDALYETANIRTIFYRSNPNPDTRLQALNAWNIVKRNYMDKPNHPRFQRANVELSNIQ